MINLLNINFRINVDDRILNFCKEAENNYISNLNQVKEIQKMRKVDEKIKEEKVKIQNDNDEHLRQTMKSNTREKEDAFNNFNFSQAEAKRAKSNYN